MVFIETPTFTRIITSLLSDDELREMQSKLIAEPDAGDLIAHGGGIRKLRWKKQGTGKSGGIRVIYYWVVDEDQILMLIAYPKSAKDNLSDAETAALKKLVKEL
jgi:hypothetical protein